MANFKALELDYKPMFPKNMDKGIAIVGAGEIVNSSHLPAYKMAGFNIIGVYDIDGKKAESIADKFNIRNVFLTLDDLLKHPEVEVVDIAVPAKYQLEVVEQVTQKGKHVLCQKPLAETISTSKKISELVKESGVKGAVNQQMRWAPGIRASKKIIDNDWSGELLQANIQVNVFTDFASWDWLVDAEYLEIMYHSIHYIDSIKSLFGVPEYVFADAARYPGQKPKGETRTLIHFKYKGERRALIQDNHNNWADPSDWYATFRFEGTDGIIKGTNGALYNYPVGEEDTIEFCTKKINSDYWFKPKLEGKWFPHAFAGPMGELLCAIEEQREPENSIEDNLSTLQIMFASYKSIKENRPVWIHEIQ